MQRPIDLIECAGRSQALTASLRKGGKSCPKELGFLKRMPPTPKTALRGLVGGDPQTNDVALEEKAAMSLLADRTGLLPRDPVLFDGGSVWCHTPLVFL